MSFPFFMEMPNSVHHVEWKRCIPFQTHVATEISQRCAKICENRLEILNLYTADEMPSVYEDSTYGFSHAFLIRQS